MIRITDFEAEHPERLNRRIQRRNCRAEYDERRRGAAREGLFL